MLLKNTDQANRLVNGSRGVVVAFEAPSAPERMRRVSMHPPSTPLLLPVVSFQVDPHAGESGWITRMVYPEDYTVDEAGKQVASRMQIPLKLAWAISIVRLRALALPSCR